MSLIKIGRAARNKRVQARVRQRAEAVAEYWKSVSPVFDPVKGHRREPPAATNKSGAGSYRDSITATPITRDGALSFKVGPRDRKSSWIEHGTKHMPKYAPKAKVKAKFKTR